MTKHGSLAPLAEMAIEEVREAFAALAQELFQPAIEHTDAVREFQRLYPDQPTQQRLLAECVHQSEGRLLTPGEGDREIVWIKVITVPAAEYADWAAKTVEGVDRKSGRWEVVIDGGADRIAVIQLRGGVSFSSLIAKLDRPEMKDWPLVISRAPDPVSALGVGPNPNGQQLRRVVAKAIVTGLLEYDQETGFSLHSTDDQTVPLGRQPSAAMETLRRRWPALDFIESMFGRQLVVAEQEVGAFCADGCGRLICSSCAAKPENLCMTCRRPVAGPCQQRPMFGPEGAMQCRECRARERGHTFFIFMIVFIVVAAILMLIVAALSRIRIPF
jgi:hypothetical protein